MCREKALVRRARPLLVDVLLAGLWARQLLFPSPPPGPTVPKKTFFISRIGLNESIVAASRIQLQDVCTPPPQPRVPLPAQVTQPGRKAPFSTLQRLASPEV